MADGSFRVGADGFRKFASVVSDLTGQGEKFFVNLHHRIET
jgi:hypothetical protein